MKKVVIFGAGHLGEVTYEYFKNRYEIAYFLDNDAKKWNGLFCGKTILNPEVLKGEKDVMVIVPDGVHKDEICMQLYSYGIREVLLLNFSEKIYTPYISLEEESAKKEFIVQFCGGLGNQLFQYAFMRYLMLKEGKRCSVDMSYYMYPQVMKYTLQEVFSNVVVKRCNPYNREKYLLDIKMCYREKYHAKSAFDCYKSADIRKGDCGYLTGYYQSASFSEAIKDTLRKELLFGEVADSGIKKYIKILNENNSVSMHIRRGDYFSEANKDIYGSVCDKEYYIRAMKYISQVIDNPLFVLFSDDIEWVKKNYGMQNVIYVEPKKFQKFNDWYDMYLMSMCKHNIIANSTFSWWGAWLNNHEKKIVIAPQKWFAQDALLDICPVDWVRL